jgi:hypothetical protein
MDEDEFDDLYSMIHEVKPGVISTAHEEEITDLLNDEIWFYVNHLKNK